MAFERFALVRVPFPFTDRTATKNRPALVLSDAASFNAPAGHSVLAMITTLRPSFNPVIEGGRDGRSKPPHWPARCEVSCS